MRDVSEERVAPEVRGAGWGLFWWGLAAFVHTAAVGAIIYLTPLREWVFGRSEPEAGFAALEGSRMRRIVEALLEVHTKRVQEKIATQKQLLAEIAQARDQRYDRYAAQARRAVREGEPAATPAALASLGPAGPDTDLAVAGKDLVDLYEVARTIERTTFGTYRQMRAIELARIQNLPLAEAFDVTNVAVPTHPEVDRGVFAADVANATDGRLQALKDELSKIHAEIGSMIAAAMRMLDTAHGLMGADVGGISVIGSGGVFEGSGSGRWGSDVGPSLAPHEFYPGNRDGDFGPDFRPVPGRKLMDDGRTAEWMYIDTWYIIGPFPNPNREYMDKKFPPESVVDLDATYIGKDGRRLRWQFMQSSSLMIAPHLATNYAVWYAYTEIYADKPQDRWAAFGSDDYSKVWLNGELVWTSGKTPHKWIPDRGFRKLRFRQGHNPLLLKLENAGGTTGFSVVFYLGSAEIATKE